MYLKKIALTLVIMIATTGAAQAKTSCSVSGQANSNGSSSIIFICQFI